VQETGKQFIFITHKAEVYGLIADKILLTRLVGKTTEVSEVTFDEIVNNYTYKVKSGRG